MEQRTLVLYRIDDLFFRAKIEQIAASSSARFEHTSSIPELASLAGRENIFLIVCDAHTVRDELPGIKELATKANTKTIGYYSHRDVELGKYARNSGIDYVVPRSAFESKLRDMLKS